MKRSTIVILLGLIGFYFGAGTLRAQERIYVGQNNPASAHAFTFDGSQFFEQTLDPSSPDGKSLRAGLDPFSMTATDHLFVVASGFQGLTASVIDPGTRTELPRIEGTVWFSFSIFTTPDQHYALVSGGANLNVMTPFLSVLDIWPPSLTFLKEIRSLQLLPIPSSGDPVLRSASRVNSILGVLSPDGLTLYVAASGLDLGHDAAIIAIDVSNPGSPSIAGAVRISRPSGAFRTNVSVSGLRFGTIGGQPYLFVPAGDLYLIPLSGGAFGPPVVMASRNPGTGTPRSFTDVVIVDGTSPRAFGVTHSLSDPSNKETVVLDLSGALTSNSADDCATAHPCVSNAYLFNNQGDANLGDRLELSFGGTYLYALDAAGDPFFYPSALLAFDPISLASGSGNPLLGRCNIDSLAGSDVNSSTDFVSFGTSLFVRNAVTASASSVTIADANVDGGKIFTNELPRTLTVSGTGLGNVVHAYLGKTRLSILSQSDGSLSAAVPGGAVPDRIPSGNPLLILVDSSSGFAKFSGFTVNDPAQYQPKAVVYAVGGSCDLYSSINAASDSEVVTNYPTISQAPTSALVTKDGRYLFVNGFRDLGRLAVHSLIADPAHGYGWNTPVETLYCEALGDILQNPDPLRSTIYVSSAPSASITMVDPTTYPPSFIDADPSNPNGDPFLPPGINAIPLPNQSRVLAISPDGRWLYGGSSFPPKVLAINVSTDVVTASNVTAYAIPDLAPPSPGGRTDGLAVSSDGARLFFANVNDAFVRVFPRNSSDGSVDTSDPNAMMAPPAAEPWSAGDVRRILAAPDGRFVYVSSRGEQRIDIFDAANLSWIGMIPVDLFASIMSVTPANPTNDFLVVGVGENDSVLTVDERPGSPTLHQVLTVTSGTCGTSAVTVSPGVGTPAGSNVTVTPRQDTTISFSNVTSPGNTTVTSTNNSSLTVPPNFEVAGTTPVFYDVSTTAAFSGPVTVCFHYDDTGMTAAQESSLRLLHQSGSTFVDVTTSLDTTANTICGQVSSFSQFVVALPVFRADIGAARIWVGLKNGDDVGTRFDLKAEVLKNGSVIGSGEIDSVPGGGSGFSKAVLSVIPQTLPGTLVFTSGDTLSIRLSVRAGAAGHRSGTARLWFNDSTANSRVEATSNGVPSNFYLLDAFGLGTSPGPGPRETKDVSVDRAVGGNPFKPFGTWSKTF